MRELRRLEFESVLDMGCGEGTLLRMIAERYPKVSLAGSELSATALRYCKEQLPRAHLFRLDIVRDEVQPQTYDLIISVQVLEHLKDDLAALRNLWAMCRRYVLISVPGGELDEHGRRMGHYRHYYEGRSRSEDGAGRVPRSSDLHLRVARSLVALPPTGSAPTQKCR